MSSGASMRNPDRLVCWRVNIGLSDTDTDGEENDDISHYSPAPRSPTDFFYPRRDENPLDVGTYFVLSRTSRGLF